VTRFSELRTPGGYLCGEVASALQKEIRRGNEREALFWATELDLAGFGNYVWKRLRIIASEDVGIADSSVALTVRALYENWLELKKKKDENPGHYRVMLVHAVCLLARAPKSRMLDHVLMLTYYSEREPLEIPDYALDMHTARGRSKKRGFTHFFEEGAKLENVGFQDSYAEEARRRITSEGVKQQPPRGQLEFDES
jgi:replication-associated recombination protein RarA